MIPARGGSERIPRKNLRLMNGKPLLAYSIENALRSRLIDKVVVSTDDEEIAHVAESLNVEVLWRDAKLAAPEVSLDPVIHDAVIRLEEAQKKTFRHRRDFTTNVTDLKC